MRVTFRAAVLAATAALAGLAWSPGTAAAATTTLELSCIAPDLSFVSIIDTQTSHTAAGGTVQQVDQLTAPNGAQLSYRSTYKHYSDDVDSWIAGPRILDTGELEGGIFYLQGKARVNFSGGGYTASFTANRVTDVCAALGYPPA